MTGNYRFRGNNFEIIKSPFAIELLYIGFVLKVASETDY